MRLLVYISFKKDASQYHERHKYMRGRSRLAIGTITVAIERKTDLVLKQKEKSVDTIQYAVVISPDRNDRYVQKDSKNYSDKASTIVGKLIVPRFLTTT